MKVYPASVCGCDIVDRLDHRIDGSARRAVTCKEQGAGQYESLSRSRVGIECQYRGRNACKKIFDHDYPRPAVSEDFQN